MVNTKLLETFIARLFVNSFDNAGVKQNFKLQYEENSLTGQIKKTLGTRYVNEALGVSLDIFNSSSVAATYMMAVMKVLDKGRRAVNVNSYWNVPRDFLLNKMITRRTG